MKKQTGCFRLDPTTRDLLAAGRELAAIQDQLLSDLGQARVRLLATISHGRRVGGAPLAAPESLSLDVEIAGSPAP